MSINLEEKLANNLKELPSYIREYINYENDHLSVKSRIAYTLDLKVFLQFLLTITDYTDIKDIPVELIDSLHTTDMDAYMSWLSYYKIGDEEYRNSPTGKKRKLSSVKALFKYLRKVGKMNNNPAEFTQMPKITDKEIVVLSPNEQGDMLSNVINATNKTGRELIFHERTKLRDLCIIIMFLGTGMRVSELVNINDTDLDLSEQRVLITRKGGKRAFVYFGDDVLEALSNYIENERYSLLGFKSKKEVPDGLPLFVSRKRNRISVRMVEVIIKNYARFVLPPSVKVTPHTLRKTYGTLSYNKYKDLYLTQNALGHSSPATTAKYYTKWNEDYLKKLKEYDVKK